MLSTATESKIGLWYPKLLEGLIDSIIWRGFQSPVDDQYCGVPESEKWGAGVRIWVWATRVEVQWGSKVRAGPMDNFERFAGLGE